MWRLFNSCLNLIHSALDLYLTYAACIGMKMTINPSLAVFLSLSIVQFPHGISSYFALLNRSNLSSFLQAKSRLNIALILAYQSRERSAIPALPSLSPLQLINSLIIVKTSLYKIPPNLPLLKGGIIPLFEKEGRGEIF